MGMVGCKCGGVVRTAPLLHADWIADMISAVRALICSLPSATIRAIA
eukprot:SAG11_NODE_25744_length_354_cov_1.533333_2_plen_46_part_01